MTFAQNPPRSSLSGNSFPDPDRPASGVDISSLNQQDGDLSDRQPTALDVATGVYVTIHGHFYQPPRENPYLDAIELQPSAAPFHDWNERIYHECYRPNAFARIFNDRGEVVGIVNNYEYLSFNIGPTLMNWLERYDTEVYNRIVEADRRSCDRLHGHGNAIAQVYNHIIMPLANQRDKYTQIRWGKADFRAHFGRDPEGMWLAETAVDYATLEVLIAEGIKFIILAPSQAAHCRPLPTDHDPNPEWHAVGGAQIDTTRPYRCFLHPATNSSDTSSSNHLPYIDIFFYDGPISRDMGFGEVLYSSHNFASRLGLAVRGDHRPAQLISVATDGETFGHHKHGVERSLAYAFVEEFPRQGWTVTNFAHYLSLSPPTWEVQLKPVTAWSCAHGVDRWQDDCGCGGSPTVHQKWRRPLRDTLDWLRDQLIAVYEMEGQRLFRDPWQTRNDYIQVIQSRHPAVVTRFLEDHATHALNAEEQVDALRLLEMQRHALLMYTSCGWFFEELSRPEGTQVLRYAARALELAGDVTGVRLESEFIQRLADAPSNVEQYGHGAEVYRQLVQTSQISLRQVAAHYAISSLFTTYAQEQQFYCYTIQQVDYQLQRLGTLTLAIGQLQLTSDITWESVHLMFAVLHLGGWDFHCCIQPCLGRRDYTRIKDSLTEVFQQASAARTILLMQQLFGEESFSLQDLFAEDRHRIIRLLTQATLTRLDQLYNQVYRDNYGILMAFQRDELEVPQELQVAAEVALSNQVQNALRSLSQEIIRHEPQPPHLGKLEAIAHEANHLGCKLNIPDAKTTLEQLIVNLIWELLHSADLDYFEAAIEHLMRLMRLGQVLQLDLNLSPVQELLFGYLHHQIGCVIAQRDEVPSITPPDLVDTNLPQLLLDTDQIQLLLKLAYKLGIHVTPWLRN